MTSTVLPKISISRQVRISILIRIIVYYSRPQSIRCAIPRISHQGSISSRPATICNQRQITGENCRLEASILHSPQSAVTPLWIYMWGLICATRAIPLSLWSFVAGTSQVARQSMATRHAFHTTTTLSAGLSSPQYVLQYDYIEDVLDKRAPFREGHLALAQEMIQQGTCLSGGPYSPTVDGAPPTGAYFFFTEQQAAERFVREDPYVAGGIVTGHSIVEWNVVVQKED